MACSIRICSRTSILACRRVTVSSASLQELESDESRQSSSVSKPLSLEVNGTTSRMSLFLWNFRTLPRRGLPSPVCTREKKTLLGLMSISWYSVI